MRLLVLAFILFISGCAAMVPAWTLIVPAAVSSLPSVNGQRCSVVDIKIKPSEDDEQAN